MSGARYTEQEYHAVLKKWGRGGSLEPGKGGVSHASKRKREVRSEVGNLTRAPYRSKTEVQYSRYLHTLMLAGDIQRYSYEPIRLNLAPKTTLTPDFLVVNNDGSIEFHETKGWAREDAMVKLKIAARLYPQWKFWLVTKKRGVWEQRELPV